MNDTDDRVAEKEPEIILGNASSRFSGVTSTMLQVLSVQKRKASIAVLGKHYVPADVPTVSFWQLARISRRPMPDGRWRVFHARRNDEMIQVWLLKKLLGAKIKAVFTSTAQRPKTWITRFLMRQMDGLLSTCSPAARYMTLPPDRVIPHGVDAGLYHPAADRAQLWAGLGLPGSYGIGIFGRVRRQKGVDTLIDALVPLLPNYPDFTVVIVGEITKDQQSFFEAQQEKLRQAGLLDRVVFTDKLPFERIPDYFRAMDIVTALSRNEGFGLTVLEAMSSGAAVVATEAGAWPDIVADGVDGYLVPVGDVEAIRAKLETLMDNAALREHMGALGRKKVLKSYTVEREASALLEYYRAVQAGSKSANN